MGCGACLYNPIPAAGLGFWGKAVSQQRLLLVEARPLPVAWLLGVGTLFHKSTARPQDDCVGDAMMPEKHVTCGSYRNLLNKSLKWKLQDPISNICNWHHVIPNILPSSFKCGFQLR